MRGVKEMDFRNRKSENGFTILEMTIALTIMGIIFSVMAAQLAPIRKSWDTSKADNEIIQNARVFTDHIERSLSQADQISAVSSPSSDNGYIEFTDAQSNTLRYELGNDGYIKYGQVGNTAQLAGPVSSLNFECYSLQNMSEAITDPNSIRYVKTNVNFANSSENGRDRQFTSSVFIRANKKTASSVASRLAVSNEINLGWNTIVDSYRSSEGYYNAPAGGNPWRGRGRGQGNNNTTAGSSSNAIVTTNSTGNSKITLNSQAKILGDVYVGPDGDPESGISKYWQAEITGTEDSLTSEIPIPDTPVPNRYPFTSNPENGLMLTGHKTEVINGDRYLKDLRLYNNSRLKVNKDVTIVVEGDIEISYQAKIELHKKGSLNLYAKDSVNFFGNINANTSDPRKVNIYITGMNKQVGVYGNIYAAVKAPYSSLSLYWGSEFFGTYAGRNFYSYSGSNTHLDLDLPAIGGGGSGELLP
jgi:prepilin-type N-terminal cleavage/methylation domain-containing protein